MRTPDFCLLRISEKLKLFFFFFFFVVVVIVAQSVVGSAVGPLFRGFFD